MRIQNEIQISNLKSQISRQNYGRDILNRKLKLHVNLAAIYGDDKNFRKRKTNHQDNMPIQRRGAKKSEYAVQLA